MTKLAVTVATPNEPLLDVQAVAALLNVPVSWVYSSAEQGTLPSVKVGRYVRFVASDIAAWLEQRRSSPSQARLVDIGPRRPRA